MEEMKEMKEIKVIKIEIQEGFEFEKTEIVDGAAVVTFKKKERKLPRSFAEFCEMFPDFTGEYFIQNKKSEVRQVQEMQPDERRTENNAEILPDRATAEAVRALCQLIQLRNVFNGDWLPDWRNNDKKWMILFSKNKIETTECSYITASELYFKTEELRDEFLSNFRPLIEKLKPLFGISL